MDLVFDQAVLEALLYAALFVVDAFAVAVLLVDF